MNVMTCRNCGAGLEADRIDSSLAVATCGHCGSLHEMPNAMADTSVQAGSVGSSSKSKRIDVALPSRFDVQKTETSLQVTWAVGGIFHGVVLTLMAAGFAYAALSSGMFFLLGGSLGLLYLAVVRTVNKRRIRVDRSSLQVAQGPMPWPGARTIDASDIEQLFATEHETRSESGEQDSKEIHISKHYRLSANTRSKGRVTILGGLRDPLQALWLEQEIEQVLGLSDRRVAGEHVL